MRLPVSLVLLLLFGVVFAICLPSYVQFDQHGIDEGFVLTEFWPTHYTFSQGNQSTIVKIPAKRWQETFSEWIHSALKAAQSVCLLLLMT